MKDYYQILCGALGISTKASRKDIVKAYAEFQSDKFKQKFSDVKKAERALQEVREAYDAFLQGDHEEEKNESQLAKTDGINPPGGLSINDKQEEQFELAEKQKMQQPAARTIIFDSTARPYTTMVKPKIAAQTIQPNYLHHAVQIELQNEDRRNQKKYKELARSIADKQDYYDILGLSKNDSQEDIHKAYHGIQNVLGKDSATKSKKLNEVFAILSDGIKRAEYDRLKQQHHWQKQLDRTEIQQTGLRPPAYNPEASLAPRNHSQDKIKRENDEKQAQHSSRSRYDKLSEEMQRKYGVRKNKVSLADPDQDDVNGELPIITAIKRRSFTTVDMLLMHRVRSPYTLTEKELVAIEKFTPSFKTSGVFDSNDVWIFTAISHMPNFLKLYFSNKNNKKLIQKYGAYFMNAPQLMRDMQLAFGVEAMQPMVDNEKKLKIEHKIILFIIRYQWKQAPQLLPQMIAELKNNPKISSFLKPNTPLGQLVKALETFKIEVQEVKQDRIDRDGYAANNIFNPQADRSLRVPAFEKELSEEDWLRLSQ